MDVVAVIRADRARQVIACVAAVAMLSCVITPARADAQEPIDVPAWAYPTSAPAISTPTTSVSSTKSTAPATSSTPVAPLPDPTPLHVPGSAQTFTKAQTTDLFTAPDWFPDAHPPMPEVVARGRPPTVQACAFCHLPTGNGRPENAAVAGLPAEYIAQQVRDFASGARRSAWHGGYRPTDLMSALAKEVTEAELIEAAAYFSRLPVTRRAEIVEVERAPRTHVAGLLYAVTEGAGDEPLGERIIEVALDQDRHELRDPQVTYRAYVPSGSLARGRTIVSTGADGLTLPCGSCHGPELRGLGVIPPIAGRSPTYILRQLLAFRTGARATPAGVPMQAVVGKLTLADMIAIAAYVGTLGP